MFAKSRRKNCVVCRSRLYDDLVQVGAQYPSAIYPRSAASYKKMIKPSSLNLTKCTNPRCGLVHLSYKYDLDYVLENYPYLSGTTATMNRILADVARETEGIARLGKKDVVLDIGGNDGTLLSLLSKNVYKKVNIDPAAGITSVINDPDYIKVQGKFSALAYQRLKLPAPRLIFSIAMFYHIHDPVGFCRQVKRVMSDRTIWCIQMTYLGSMLESNIYDNIVHEHVAYYSLYSLGYLMQKVGLSICDAKIVDSYGGSLRVYVMKDRKKFPRKFPSRNYIGMEKYESNRAINSVEALTRFNDRIQLLRECTRELILHINDQYGKIWAFGASTKGNMLCQFLGLNRQHVQHVLDNNSKKVGLIMTGSDIPIVDEKHYISRLPKYLLVLPYYYVGFFRKIIKKNLRKGQSTYLIIPLPIPRIEKLTGK